MAVVVVTETARRDLEALIRSHSLPASTHQRLRASIEPMRDFPDLGARLRGRWADLRFVLGSWRWMIVVYRYDPEADQVAILAIQDGRSARASAGR